jgi:dihydroneopterin aldolase
VTTPHRSTPEHWAAVEAYAQQVSSTDDCLLELRARVEALEAAQQDEEADIVDYYAALSAQHQGGAVFHGNLSSLVERVAATLHEVTNSDPNVPANEWEPEARAAIREVNAWLRERAGGTRASWLLDNEIEQ